MKIQRTKNAARNVVFGVLYKSYITIVPFFIRTAIIYFLGVQYLGLNGIFASILNVLNLAELGVGEAMVFSMYKPIAEDDAPTISALMNLYRKYYRLIGLVIGALGLLLLPFLRYLIKDELPRDVNLYILYLMYLSVTVLSYWLYAYKGALLRAHQRSDVTSKITIAVVTSKYLFQFLALILTRNYYLFTIALIATQILQNIVTAKVVDRLYPDYQPRGELPPEKIKEIGGRIRDLFTVKISTVVVTSADAVVVSAFLGLHTLAIYQNYFIILTSVTGMMEILFSACLAGIGNSIVVESKEKNYRDIKKMTLITAWAAGFCTCCLLCLYQPFMRIWMNHNADLMLGSGEVICFCVYFFFIQMNRVICTYKDAAGIWHQTRFVPLANAVVNLTLNLILVQFWGLYGVLLSTVIAYAVIEIPLFSYNLFLTVFDPSGMKEYFRNLLYYVAVTLVSCGITLAACLPFKMNDIALLFVRGSICILIPNVIYYMAYRRKEEFAGCVQTINYVVKGRLPLIRRRSAKANRS